MKHVGIALGVLSVLFLGAKIEGKKDPCQLKGSVFVETVANFADYRVYMEPVEAFAQLKVYKESAPTFAQEPGEWYFTDVKGFADFTIYIEPVKNFADFTLAYTDYRQSAGCKR